MTPRQAARQHLPELDRDWPEWVSRFNAELLYLTTPEGTWGNDPSDEAVIMELHLPLWVPPGRAVKSKRHGARRNEGGNVPGENR